MQSCARGAESARSLRFNADVFLAGVVDMNKFLIASVLAFTAWLATPPAQAGVDVGVSIAISQPGVYGRIDIGRFPQPRVLLPQPVRVLAGPQSVQPVYLWVPGGHRKNWKRHCSSYGACGVPVYFVEHGWYDKHVRKGRPGYRAERIDDRRDWREECRDDRGDRRDDRRGQGRRD
jgi:hypothetical protein